MAFGRVSGSLQSLLPGGPRPAVEVIRYIPHGVPTQAFYLLIYGCFFPNSENPSSFIKHHILLTISVQFSETNESFPI